MPHFPHATRSYVLNDENFSLAPIIMLADAYKYSHAPMYWEKCVKIRSYFESRGSSTFPFAKGTAVFGMQYFLKKYFKGQVVKEEDLMMLEYILEGMFGTDQSFIIGEFMYLAKTYNGALPLEIRAVKEGTILPLKNVAFDVTATDERLFWLANFVETLLQNNWYPDDVSTLSYEINKMITHAFHESVDEANYPLMKYVLNDFGARGVGEPNISGLGGMAHLTNSFGSDNVFAAFNAIRYYGADPDFFKNEVFARTVPASEHSVMTLKGKAGEAKVFARCLNIYPEGIISLVGDGFSIFNVAGNILPGELRDQIVNRKGCLVLRLDSGDPKMTIKTVMEILFENFGYTINSKGYKVLPPYIRIMQADGVNYFSIKEIYTMLLKEKISAENIVFGMGGALLQKVNRDDFNFALKCSSATFIGEDGKLFTIDVAKSPEEMDEHGVIHQSFKTSKPGHLKLIINEEGVYQTVGFDDPKYASFEDQLVLVFRNGELFNTVTFQEIKDRLQSFMDAEVAAFEAVPNHDFFGIRSFTLEDAEVHI